MGGMVQQGKQPKRCPCRRLLGHSMYFFIANTIFQVLSDPSYIQLEIFSVPVVNICLSSIYDPGDQHCWQKNFLIWHSENNHKEDVGCKINFVSVSLPGFTLFPGYIKMLWTTAINVPLFQQVLQCWPFCDTDVTLSCDIVLRVDPTSMVDCILGVDYFVHVLVIVHEWWTFFLQADLYKFII